MAVLEDTPDRKVFEIAGHTVTVERTESGRRWHMRCSCGAGHPQNPGHKPQTFATQRVAIGKGVYHVKRIEADARRAAYRDGLRRPSAPLSHAPDTTTGTAGNAAPASG